MIRLLVSVLLSIIFSSCLQPIGPNLTDPDPGIFFPPGECIGNIPTLKLSSHQFCLNTRVMNGESQGTGISYLNVGTIKELLPKLSSGTKDQVKIYIEDQRMRAPNYGNFIYSTDRISRAYRCIQHSALPNTSGLPTIVCQGSTAYDRAGKKVVVTEVFSNGYARVFFKENRQSVNGVVENKFTETRGLNTLRPIDSNEFFSFDCNQMTPKNCNLKF